MANTKGTEWCFVDFLLHFALFRHVFYLIGLLLYLCIYLFILIFGFEKESVDASFCCFVFTSCLAGVELFFEKKESIESVWYERGF